MNKPVAQSILGIREKRSHSRAAVDLGAIVEYQDERYDCSIRDISPRGFFISCSYRFPLHQFLHLHCHLYLTRKLSCVVEVMHVNDAGMGARIVSIDEENRQLLLHFVRHFHQTDRDDLVNPDCR